MREKAKYKIGDVFEYCDGELTVSEVEFNEKTKKYHYILLNDTLLKLGEGGYEWNEDEMPKQVKFNMFND